MGAGHLGASEIFDGGAGPARGQVEDREQQLALGNGDHYFTPGEALAGKDVGETLGLGR